MIVWFNCKITDERLNPQNIIRYNLRDDNRFDVARYSFASFAPLEPLVSKFIFNSAYFKVSFVKQFQDFFLSKMLLRKTAVSEIPSHGRKCQL